MVKGESVKEMQVGIDAFDIAAIMGVNKKRSAYDVYLDKINYSKENEMHEESLAKSREANYWLNTAKEILAKEFSIRIGKKVRKENKKLTDEENYFMIGNIDRKIVGENSILMCKSSNLFFPREWNGDILPASYILESQHYMRVSKADKCYIASLIGGKRFVYKEVLRDEKMISMIIKIEKDFWFNNILKKVPPKIN